MSRLPHKAGRVPYSTCTHAPYDLPEYRGGGNGGFAYAIWNEADKSASITVTGDGLQYYGSGWSSIRATVGNTDVDESFEIRCEAGGDGNFIFGVGTSSANIESFCGSDAHGWGVYSAGYSTHNGVTNDVAPFAAGTWVLIEIDRTNNQARFYVVANGVSRTLLKTHDITAASGLPLFPMGSPYSGNTGTATFGQTALIGPLSAGIREGVYTT